MIHQWSSVKKENPNQVHGGNIFLKFPEKPLLAGGNCSTIFTSYTLLCQDHFSRFSDWKSSILLMFVLFHLTIRNVIHT